MIDQKSFGSTGFESSRVLFGAAALAFMKPARADKTFALLERFGVNHIDVAASYGDAELNLADWLSDHRSRVFLATKTGKRTAPEARAELEKSLRRMGVDSVDLIQFHNLVDEPGWQSVMGSGGALEAMIQAGDEGLVRFIGVTGHGTYAPSMHLRSLDVFPFASVLCPLNFSMMSQPIYKKDFDALAEACRKRGVALQTIKSIARRRWPEEGGTRFSWYEPLRDEAALDRAVRWVLSHADVFLNSSSDGGLLEATLQDADLAATHGRPTDAEMRADAAAFSVQPLFERDVSDAI